MKLLVEDDVSEIVNILSTISLSIAQCMRDDLNFSKTFSNSEKSMNFHASNFTYTLFHGPPFRSQFVKIRIISY